jgi:hypothetical protein
VVVGIGNVALRIARLTVAIDAQLFGTAVTIIFVPKRLQEGHLCFKTGHANCKMDIVRINRLFATESAVFVVDQMNLNSSRSQPASGDWEIGARDLVEAQNVTTKNATDASRFLLVSEMWCKRFSVMAHSIERVIRYHSAIQMASVLQEIEQR